MPNTITLSNTSTHQAWFSATCVGKTQETHDTFSYEFKAKTLQVKPFLAGSHLTVRLPAGPNKAWVNRTYTLSSSPKHYPFLN